MSDYADKEEDNKKNIQRWRASGLSPMDFYSERVGGFRDKGAEQLYKTMAAVVKENNDNTNAVYSKLSAGALARDIIHRYRSGSFFLRYAYASSRYQGTEVVGAVKESAKQGSCL